MWFYSKGNQAESFENTIDYYFVTVPKEMDTRLSETTEVNIGSEKNQ